MRFSGEILLLGDDVNTDQIISGKYLRTDDQSVWRDHILESLDPRMPSIVATRRIIVGGRNFGCGSSREQAAIAIKESGILAVIVPSIASIFFRNCVNIGLLVVTSDELGLLDLEDGDEVVVDDEAGTVCKGAACARLHAVAPFILDIVREGGLLEYFMKRGALHV